MTLSVDDRMEWWAANEWPSCMWVPEMRWQQGEEGGRGGHVLGAVAAAAEHVMKGCAQDWQQVGAGCWKMLVPAVSGCAWPLFPLGPPLRASCPQGPH
jgi:hypothetical protein